MSLYVLTFFFYLYPYDNKQYLVVPKTLTLAFVCICCCIICPFPDLLLVFRSVEPALCLRVLCTEVVALNLAGPSTAIGWDVWGQAGFY